MSDSFHELMQESDFPETGKVATIVNGWHVLVARIDGEFHAVNDRCTHAASHLSGGRIRRGAVMCPLHGARFDFKTGKCLGGAYANLRTFEVKLKGGAIQVAIPDEKPGMSELPVGDPG